jgi:DNA-binding transcriptional MocR family regulator
MKLTATQERILHAAAERPSRDIEPLPSNVNAGVRQRVIDGLLKRGLIEFKGGIYRISSAGNEAIGKQPKADKPTTRPGTKQARMIELMRRPQGASIKEIVAETGWLPHTVRGTMTNALKKRLGLTLTSEKANGEPRRYRIA